MEEQMSKKTSNFPIVDAVLTLPPEGREGIFGVCTNTLAPGQVLNEIELKKRENVSILGPLIVNKDGVERLIVNSLVHSKMKYLILFSEEASLFFPSTNLLMTMIEGVTGVENKVNNSLGSVAYYPNIPKNLVEEFRKRIVPIPLFMSHSEKSKEVVERYIDEYLSGILDENTINFLKKVNSKKKIYYDKLNELLEKLAFQDLSEKESIELNSNDFKHLQPPKINLDPMDKKVEVPFNVENKDGKINLNIKIKDKEYLINGSDDFLISYSLMKELGKEKENFTSLDQLLLGADLARVDTEIKNNFKIDSFVKPLEIKDGKELKIAESTSLIPDKKYYYRVNAKEKNISVSCLTHDTCEDVYELISSDPLSIIYRLAKDNRFEDYEMDILHRMDIGAQVARAGIAVKNNCLFLQDLSLLFKENKTHLPLYILKGEDFLEVHKKIIQKIYTGGLTESHADERKGTARSASVLAVFEASQKAFSKMPNIYKSEGEDSKEVREAYKKELLSFETDGHYAYGERTRSYFGFDQLSFAVETLKKNPQTPVVVQRYAPDADMELYVEEETGELKATEDPCLTNDIFWLKNGKLNSFHIARAHNIVNAYPQNLFGLYDAYFEYIRDELNVDFGSMYMLSNRANILLLTESQKSQRIIAESSKPSDKKEESGPFLINKEKRERNSGEVHYEILESVELSEIEKTKKPNSEIIEKLENYKGVNTLEKAAIYLFERGVNHNNPVLSTFIPSESDSVNEEMSFYQANVFGGKVYATAVFTNISTQKREEINEVVKYISSRFVKKLGYPSGDINIFYIG